LQLVEFKSEFNFTFFAKHRIAPYPFRDGPKNWEGTLWRATGRTAAKSGVRGGLPPPADRIAGRAITAVSRHSRRAPTVRGGHSHDRRMPEIRQSVPVHRCPPRSRPGNWRPT
jgi:hypothetical protein